MPRDSSNEKYPSLHSNMFLLILRRSSGSWPGTCFTFQYVSINTRGNLSSPPRPYHFTFQYVSINTHSLSLAFSSVCSFTFQYVSINTESGSCNLWQIFAFTFQYVSINTKPQLPVNKTDILLYIPICFY